MTTWKVVAGCACAVKLLSGRQAALMRLRAAVGSGSLAARLLPCSYLHSAHSAQGQTPSARVVACSSHGSTAAQRSFERIFHLSAPDGIRSGNITEDSRRSEVLELLSISPRLPAVFQKQPCVLETTAIVQKLHYLYIFLRLQQLIDKKYSTINCTCVLFTAANHVSENQS